MAKKDAFGNFDPKELKAFIKELERAKKSSSDWKEVLDGISSTFFGFSASAIFKEVPKSVRQTTEESALLKQSIVDVQKAGIDLQAAFVNNKITDSLGNVRNASEVLGSSLRGTMSDGTNTMNAILSKMEDFSKNSSGLWSNLSLEEQAVLASKLTGEGFEFLDSVESIQERYEIVRTLLSGQEESITKLNKGLLPLLATHESLEGVMENEVSALNEAVKKQREAQAIKNNQMKGPNFIDILNNSVDALQKNLGPKLITSLNELDKGFHEIQKNSGIMIADGHNGLTKLMNDTAQYGMKIGDVADLMGRMNEELRTTDSGVMMRVVDSAKSLNLALGIGAEETSKIYGEMMRAGHSVEDVKESFLYANKNAKMLGLSSKAVVKQISNNIEKMRQFGFEGGIKSLTKMAAKAESLRIQVDEIFDVAKRARTIEGAMEMASQLQLAGGSFSNINPMELLSAARKGPEELGKILTTMGGDIGHWSDDMKSYEFNPIDVDRLQLVADATGMTLDSLQKVIQKNAEITKKTDFFGGDDMFASAIQGMEDMDAEMAKSTMSDLIEWDGKKKTFVLTTDENKLNKLQKAGITDISQINAATTKSFLEMNAQEQLSLEEQAKQNRSLQDSFNAFVNSITNVMTVFQPLLNSVTSVIDYISSEMGTVGKSVIAGIALGIPLISGAISLFIKPLIGMIKSIKGLSGAIPEGGGGAAKGGFLSGLSGGVSAASKTGNTIDMKGLGKLAMALGIIGAATIGFTAALAAFGGEPGMMQMVGAVVGMGLMIGGLSLLSKIPIDEKNIIKTSIAMAIIGASMIPFAYAMSMMTEINWNSVGGAVAAMGLAVGALFAIGAIVANPAVASLLLTGAAALTLVGVAMMAAAQSLIIAGEGMSLLANVDWDSILKMGSVMMAVAPAMIAFGLASMAFANPIAMIGMGLMTLQLLGLAVVMVPLSAALLTSSESMERFVSSMEKMKKGVTGVDLGGIFDGVADAMSKMNDVLEDSDMERVTQALSSIRVNIDSSSVDGLKSMIVNMPALVLHVDGSEMKGMMASLSSVKIGLDVDRIQKQAASLPMLEVKFDDKGLLSVLSSVPSIDVKLNEGEISRVMDSIPEIKMQVDTDGIAKVMDSIPEIKMQVDTDGIAKVMNDLPALRVTIDMETMLRQLSQLPSVKVSMDLKELQGALSKLDDIKIGIDPNGISDMPDLRANVNMDEVIRKLSSLPDVEVKLNVNDVMSLMSEISSTSVSMDLELHGIEELKSILLSNSTVLVEIDASSLNAMLNELKGVRLNIDTEAVMSDVSMLKDIQLVISVSNLDEVIAMLSSIELNVEPALDRLSSLSVRMNIDDVQVQEQVSRLQDLKLVVDTSQLKTAIDALNSAEVRVDISSLMDQLDSMPKFNIGIDRSEVERMVDLLSSIRVSLDMTALENSLSGLKVSVDTAQLDRSISEMSAVNMADISKSLASIEAKVSKFNEGPASTVKVISEDLGSTSSKLQAEMMVRLADAIDRLSSASTERSGDRKIIVELEMDGRQMKTKILKDTSLMS